jgi:hypothetical protein
MGTFLPLIDAAFTKKLAAFGFDRTTFEHDEYTGSGRVEYALGEQRVGVSYERTRDQWCEVWISGYGNPEPIRDVLGFVRGVEDADVAYMRTDDPVVFSREAERISTFLIAYCSDFLKGDIFRFRQRYRELFIVSHIRHARYNAAGSHKWDDFEKYNSWISDYLTSSDLRSVAFSREIRRKFG